MIKYKGITSNLLSDLSLELGTAVNLSHSELVLLQFFKWIVSDLSTEKKVHLICNLPVHLKPFCTEIHYQKKTNAAIIPTQALKKTHTSVLNILKKYMPADSFILMCSCLPEAPSHESSTLPQKVFLVA
jgi:hypothetical protein